MKIIVNIDGYAGIYNPADPDQDILEAAISSGFEYRLVEESELPEEKPMKQKWIWSSDGKIEISPFSGEEIRAQRDSILVNVVDRMVGNPLRWAEMTPEQQQSWAEYRTALLNVPQQSGFPQNIIWPEQP